MKYSECYTCMVSDDQLRLVGSLYSDFAFTDADCKKAAKDFICEKLSIFPNNSEVLCLMHDNRSGHKWGVILIKPFVNSAWMLVAEFGHYNELGEKNKLPELDDKYFNFIEAKMYDPYVKPSKFDVSEFKMDLGKILNRKGPLEH